MKWGTRYLRVVYALLTIGTLVLASGAFMRWG